MGARKRGGRVMGRGGGYGGVGLCVCVSVCVCVKACMFVCRCQVRVGGRWMSSRCRRCIDGQRIEQQKRVRFQILGTRTWVCCGVRKRVGDAT